MSTPIHVSGTVRANSGVANGYHFVGLKFHFYYYNGSITEIGTYQIYKPSTFTITNTTSFNPSYFDGTQITGGIVTTETYSTSSALNGGIFSASFTLPYTAFPTRSGIQFYVSVEGIDQGNNTTTISSLWSFDNPILYNNGPIVVPNLVASKDVICPGDQVTLSTSPDISTSFNYQWYRDGSLLPGENGSTLLTSTTGSYHVYIYDACQSASTADLVLNASSVPTAPTVTSSNGASLCDGATTTLYTSPSFGGVIHWNTGATGNDLVISSAGNYYAYEINSCGTGTNSNTISISTGNTPPAPLLDKSGNILLCNGDGLTINSSAPVSGNTMIWNNATTGSVLTTYAAGSYYAYEYNPVCGTGPNSAIVVVSTSSTPPTPSISPAGPQTLCNGNTTVLNASGSGSMEFYYNGSPLTAANSITVSASGAYTLRASNACGTSNPSTPVDITANITPPAPTLSFSGAVTLCDGAYQPVNVTPATSGGVIHWNTGTTGNYIQLYSAGSYYAYESNPSCGSGPNSGIVSVSTLNSPSAPVVTPSINQLLCNGASIILNSSGSNITWSNGATGNTVSVSTAGTYTTFDHNYCGNSPNSNPVIVATATCPQPAPGTAFQVCPGTLKTLDAGAGYDTYVWSNGETTRNISVGPGTYSVTVTKNGCSSVSANVTVSYFTVITPVINSSVSLTICAGNTVILNSSPAVAYNWSTGNTAASISVSTAGTYFVTATDNNGCISTSNPVTVSVNPLPVAGISGSAIVCRNSSSPLITFIANGGLPPYIFTYQLNGGANQTISTVSTNTVTLPAPTSTDGSFIYSLVSIKESSSTTCSNVASGTATVIVNTLPVATISGTNSYCQNSVSPTVTFTATGGTAPYTFTYSINGGSPVSVQSVSSQATIIVPTNIAGTFVYSLISVQESSVTKCSNSASGSATITINPLPTATISGSATICSKSSVPLITFTGSIGTAPYTFIYKINGGADQSIKTVSGNSVSIPVSTDTVGTFVYSLVSVQESSGTTCLNSATGSATIVINPLPVASVTGTTTVCQNSPHPSVTLSASGAMAPYTITYRINGGALLVANTGSGNSVNIDVPTAFSGTFTYTLVTVQDNSSTHCLNAASGSAIITVNPLPSAAITGTTTICENSSLPLITFTGSNATAPYTFSYRINGGPVLTISSNGNTTTLPVPTSLAGTYVYSIVSVQESSSTACFNAAFGSATVIVNPLPTASIMGDTAVCAGSVNPLVRFTGSNASAPYTFMYTINGDIPKSITSTGNEALLPVPTAVAGIYTYSLVNVRESSSTACLNTASGSVAITVNQLPTASITGTVTVCQSAVAPMVTFSGTGGLSPYSFTYRINNGVPLSVTSVGSTISLTVSTNTPGKFVYELLSIQESSGTACVNGATGTATITVNPLPAKASLVTPNNHLCNGVSGQITIYNYTQGFSYTWFRDGALLKTSTLDTIMNVSAGKFNALVTSDKGCDAASLSDTLLITTGTVSQPVITGYTRVCPAGKTNIWVYPDDSLLDYESIQWIDITTNKIKSKLNSFSALAGEYYVRVYREGCADSLLVAVTPNDTIFPAGTILLDTNRISFGNVVTIKADVTDAVQYNWQFGDGTRSTTTGNIVQQHYFKAGDSLAIKVSAISERNCATDFSAYISVNPFDSVSIPDLSKTGKVKDWNIYPIPFHDHLKVSITLLKDETVRIDVFTIAGQWVNTWDFAGKAGDNLFQFADIGSLPSNVTYLFVSTYNNQKHYSKAFKY